jgi:hypothetical protein
MQTLSAAKTSLLDLIVREGGLQDLHQLAPSQKSDLFTKLGVVQLVMQATYGTKQQIIATQARTLRVSPQAINQWLALYNKHGFRSLVDGRRSSSSTRVSLPEITRQWIKDEIMRMQRRDAVAEVHRTVIAQWNLWRRTGDPQWAIPGFTSPPADAGKGYPAGFSVENFRRCQPSTYQKTLSAQGTISAYRSLPSILSTCVGTEYLEYVFFDDEKPDVNVRVMGFDRPMVPLCFHALERLTRYPFRPHIRLRWFDADAQMHKHLTQKEFVWYVIFLLCSEGYRTDEKGTTLIQEHGTAKVWANKELSTPDGHHSFEDALKSLTGGCVRMDSSGLFNRPAFSELLYGPQSSGNPRFKAPIESSFHLWRTYSQHLIGQTGLNVENAPEDNYGITKYEKQVLKIANDLPDSIRNGLQSNYLTGIEFATVAERIREALANRDDHNFEGWAASNFVEPVWRWQEDPTGMWRSRGELANLPGHLREHALHQQKQNPLLSTIIPWSPAIARASRLNDPAIAKLDFSAAIHLLPTTWAKHVKVRDRHQIHLTEDLLPGEELIYLPELTTPRGRTEYLQPGDELMVYLNPLMPDSVLVCDMQFQFIGTINRSIRIGRDMNQVEEMFKQRSRLKGALEAPVRRAMQPVADRRQAVRDLNADIIDAVKDLQAERAILSPSEKLREARAASAEQGQRTAAANRMQKYGEANDWEIIQPTEAATSSAWDDLPDDTDLPDAL